MPYPDYFLSLVCPIIGTGRRGVVSREDGTLRRGDETVRYETLREAARTPAILRIGVMLALDAVP